MRTPPMLYDGDMGTKKMHLTVAAPKETWSVAKITQISGKSLCVKADTASEQALARCRGWYLGNARRHIRASVNLCQAPNRGARASRRPHFGAASPFNSRAFADCANSATQRARSSKFRHI